MQHDQILTEDEAAIFLGITKELLFAYTRSEANKATGDRRRLRYNAIPAGFRKQDLVDWNNYLWEPWSASVDNRPSLQQHLVQFLQVECGGQCALCHKGPPLENAHIDPYENTKSHHHSNLVRLCTECHTKYDTGVIQRETIEDIKRVLIEQTRFRLRSNLGLINSKRSFRPPVSDSIFHGRDKERLEVRHAISSNRITAIMGIGGIGKTQLVLNSIRGIEDGPIIWIDVESCATTLDIESSIFNAIMNEFRGQEPEREFFSIKALLVLDGLDRVSIRESDGILQLIQDLMRQSNNIKLLITTQQEIDILDLPIAAINLGPLESEYARLIIDSRISLSMNIVSTEKDIQWIHNYCDGHPLSLIIAAGLIRHYKDTEIVCNLLNKYGAKRLIDPKRNIQLRSSSLEACLIAAYTALNTIQKDILLFVSNFPDGCIKHYIDMVFSTEQIAIIDDIVTLRNLSFFEMHSDQVGINRFHSLNPVREFTRARYFDEDAENALRIELEAFDCLMTNALILNRKIDSNDIEYALLRLELDLSNYFHVFNICRLRTSSDLDIEKKRKYYRVVAAIASSINRLCFIRGFIKYGYYVSKTGVSAEVELEDFDEVVQHYAMMISMALRVHDIEIVMKAIREMQNYASRSAKPETLALVAMSLGDYLEQQGNYPHAILEYKKSEELLSELIPQVILDHNSEDMKEEVIELVEKYHYEIGTLGIILSKLGQIFEHKRDYYEALDYHLRALDYIELIGDLTNLGQALHQVGNCYSGLNDQDEALIYYIRSLNVFYGLQSRQYLSNSLSEIGETIIDMGKRISIPEDLNQEILQIGLDDMISEISQFIDKYYVDHELNNQINHQWSMKIMRKAFALVKLISFTQYTEILVNWSDELHQLIEPIRSHDSDLFSIHRLGREPTIDVIISLHIIKEISIALHEFKTHSKEDNKLNQLLAKCRYLLPLDKVFFNVSKWVQILLNEK